MYVIVAEFKLKPDQVEAFARLVEKQAKDSVELEADCHQFDVCQAEDDQPVPALRAVHGQGRVRQARGHGAHVHFRAAVAPMLLERILRGFQKR